MSPPFELAEGMNTYYVKIDPDDAVAESDETNNAAKMVLNVRKVVVDRIEL